MSNKCPRCKKSVYQAEEALGAGMHWHRSCFNCNTCHKGLDSTTLTEKDGEIYCKSCYGKQFGPKGYGYGGGAGVLSTDSTVLVTSAAPAAAAAATGTCSECQATGQTGKFCSECGKPVVMGGGGGGGAATVVTAAAAPAAASKPAASTGGGGGGGGSAVASKFGGGDKCPRCGKTVYHAEKALGAGFSWHKSCFKCLDCAKMLDSDTMADKGGEIYCRACYGKKFGPKGYGYGGGAGALKNTA